MQGGGRAEGVQGTMEGGEEVAPQQCRKGKGKASEPPECSQYVEHGLECELRPGKLTLCTECREVKAKCEQPGEEKPERKRKQA